MTAEQQQELAALAALGALDGADADAWRSLTAKSPEARREADRFAGVASLLALTVRPQPPPAALKTKVLARIEKSATENPTDKFSFLLNSDTAGWKQLPIPGIRIKELAVNHAQGYAVILLEASPGASYISHDHAQAEECYVLKGDCVFEGRHLGPGDFHHAAAGTRHQPTRTVNGCTLLLVVGLVDYLRD